MKILVNEEVKEISLNDPTRQGDSAELFLDEQGALINGDFNWDDDQQAYRANPATLPQWQQRLSDRQREIDAQYADGSSPSTPQRRNIDDIPHRSR